MASGTSHAQNEGRRTTASSSATLVPHAEDEEAPLLGGVGPQKPIYGTDQLQDDVEGLEDAQLSKEVEVYVPGKANFWQTLLNMLGDILGTGLLATPIAIAHAGWVMGPLMLVIVGGLTLWTLKLMLRIIEKDRRLRSFTDVIGFGIGAAGEKWVTSFFVIECIVWSIALVVLFSDSMAALVPQYTSGQWKLFGLIVIAPTTLVPLRYLSVSSGLGTATTIGLLVILLWSGITTPTGPGALREPMPTDLWPPHGISKFFTIFGIYVACFGGHGLVPNLIHDMKHPETADYVCELAYAISMVIYLSIAICGYLMYGRNVSDEISVDLAETVNAVAPWFNKLAVFLVALTPLTKFPVAIRILGDVLATYLHLHPTVLIPSSAPTPRPPTPTSENADLEPADLLHLPEMPDAAERAHNRRERLKALARSALRLGLSIVASLGALFMPSFEKLLSLMGAGFGVASIFCLPVWAYANIYGWQKRHVLAIGIGAVFVVVGVAAVLWPESGLPDIDTPL